MACRVTTEAHSTCILMLSILYSGRTIVGMNVDRGIKRTSLAFARDRISPKQNERHSNSRRDALGVEITAVHWA